MKNFQEFWLLVENDLINKVETYLASIERAGFLLLAHQTYQDSALKVLKNKENFGKGNGVVGTALFTTSTKLRSVIEEMQKQQVDPSLRSGQIHKGANSVIVMAIPKSLNLRGLSDLDDLLFDLVGNNQLEEAVIPNKFIIGAWNADGTFLANSQFNPRSFP